MDPLRVLIVDDEAELVSALEERLNLRGFAASGVTTGAEALSLLAETPFDVVLLDLKMPGLGGLEVIRRIKEERPDLKVILLTGWGSEEDAKKGKELGAFDYLMKPVKISDLVRALLAAGDREEKQE
ncbi:MAG: response regulator [Gemmatimonadales bacterium]|jgi:DNA-binding response OmpR family regulator